MKAMSNPITDEPSLDEMARRVHKSVTFELLGKIRSLEDKKFKAGGPDREYCGYVEAITDVLKLLTESES